MVEIFSYLNYCQFLSDALQERKRNNPNFSYRYIANFLKLKSSAFINCVVHGRRKLPEALLGRMGDLLKLNDHEREYFAIMVKYNHCTNPVEREGLLRQLMGFQTKQSRELQPEQHQLFSEWFYLAVRELLRIYPFSDDYQKLSVLLRPKIKAKDAREAIAILLKIGLVKRWEDGCCRPVEALVTTGDDWVSEMIKNVQIQLADLGKNALVTIPKRERDISNLTFCASEATKRRIAEEFDSLRRKILTWSENDRNADTVYQCNMQLFPVSHSIKGVRQ